MKKWQRLAFKIYNPFSNKVDNHIAEGIYKDAQLINRAAQYAIMVEKHGIRDMIFGYLKELEKKGKVANIELVYNLFALDWMVFFSYKGKEIVIMHPVMGAPSAECLVQQAYTLGCSHFVRLGTTGSLTMNIPKYSVISSVGAIRHDGTSDNYLPQGFPATPDEEFQNEITEEIRKSIPIYKGITYTTKTRFREDLDMLIRLNKELGVVNIEMETATVFSVSKAIGMKSASISMVADCLVSEGDRKDVEGTLKGIPEYEEYFQMGFNVLLKMFSSVIEVLSRINEGNNRFTNLVNEIESSKRNHNK